MGCIKIGSSSSYDTKPYGSCPEPLKNPNPDPNNFKIVNSQQAGSLLIIKVNYPDCNNYEGNKILVYKDTDIKTLLKQKSLDPHFSQNTKFKSPIARFEPTNLGWICAIIFAKGYNECKQY